MRYICLLTGCANGIGLHLTEMLLRKGHCVVATDVDDVLLQQRATSRQWPSDRLLTIKLDVTQPSDWQKVIDSTLAQWGRIDIGMNIAGVIRPGYITDLNVTDIDFMVDINLKGVMFGTKYLSAVMLPQRSGHIVNIASLAGLAPIEGLGIYSATKSAVRFFSLAASAELQERGIHVSVVCPDLVDTNMLREQLPYEAAALTFSGNRVLKVEEVCQAILRDALERKKREIVIPSGRGWLAKIGNVFPKWAGLLSERLKKKGDEKRLSYGNITK